MRRYRDLLAWQKSMDLAALAYAFAVELPTHERYGLVNQIQRCAISIPANIAEGHERRSAKDYRRFLAIASGSLAELETHVLLAVRIGMVAEHRTAEILELAAEVGRIIRGIDRAVARRID